MKNDKKVFTANRKAFHDYEILEKVEAGIVLSGFEVKSIKCFNVSLADSIVRFSSGEAYADNMFIAPYERISTHISDYDAKRKRKLLMHKSEIAKLSARAKEKGLTAIPLEVYLSSKGKIKVLIGLGKGRKSYDKREVIKKKDLDREMSRERFSR